MAKQLSYQVLEDNGGRLHLAVFNGDECIWFASGYEYIPDNLQEDIAALYSGRHPLQEGWESYLPEGYTAQRLYDELTSQEHGWQIIADDAGVYPERMGIAGRIVFGFDDADDRWAECIWCNTISHDSLIEYDDNGEPICPECKRAGAMVKL